MKNTFLAIVFVLCMIISWLLFSVIWNIFNDLSYLETIRNPNQIYGLAFLYWWFPGMFVMEDLSE